MTLQSSGKISLSDINTEFEGSSSPRMSEFYSADSGVPVSGKISFSDFYGKSNVFVIKDTGEENVFSDSDGNFKELDLNAYMLSLGWNGSSAVEWQINPGVYVWSDDINVPALDIQNFPNGVTITNYGYIMGKGGRGGDNQRGGTFGNIGENGGPAINFDSAGATLFISNQESGYILGGGGGGDGGFYGAGGGGAGGGEGGIAWATANGNISGGPGGDLGQNGSNSQDGGGGTIGLGGSGGGTGGGQQSNKGTDSGSGGGGGGRSAIATTTSASGPSGKGADSPGGNGGGYGAGTVGASGAGGGGGWGSAGGGSSAGGKAINITNGTVVINNGSARIYGAIS